MSRKEDEKKGKMMTPIFGWIAGTILMGAAASELAEKERRKKIGAVGRLWEDTFGK